MFPPTVLTWADHGLVDLPQHTQNRDSKHLFQNYDIS